MLIWQQQTWPQFQTDAKLIDSRLGAVVSRYPGTSDGGWFIAD